MKVLRLRWLSTTILLIAVLFGVRADADALPALKFQQIDAVDGTPLNVVEAGNPDAPALLLLHGFSQSYLSFHEQLHDVELAKRFRIIAFDLRGHGGSGKPWTKEAYAGYRPWATDIRRIVETLSLEKPLLVGWSFGGYVAIDYVREYGAESVSALILTGSHGGLLPRADGPRVTFAGDLESAINNAKEFMRLMTAKPVSSEAFDRGVYSHLMMPAYVRNAMADKRLDNTDLLSSLPVRTMVFLGAQDASLPPQRIRDALTKNPNIKVKVLEGVGHSAFIEDPQLFNHELIHFAEGR